MDKLSITPPATPAAIISALSGDPKDIPQCIQMMRDMKAPAAMIEALEAKLKEGQIANPEIYGSNHTEKWLDKFITQDPTMLEMKHDVRKLASVSCTHPVLILGETGTGKELIAQALHGSRPGRFVAVNISSLPSELMASELFGHVSGAYTGAVKDRAGKFRTADRGTLFLDEIGDMNFDCQAKLLRAIQEGKVTPLGSEDEKDVKVRVVSATKCDIKQMVADGKFRDDLYFRLSLFEVNLSPLRARIPTDIALLCQSMDKKFPYNNIDWTAVDVRLGPASIASDFRSVWTLSGNVRSIQRIIWRWQTLGKL